MRQTVSPVLRTGTLVLIAAALAVAFFALFYWTGTGEMADRTTTALTATGILVAFGLAVVLPMLPGYVEVLRSRDAQSLTIDQNYSRDPRYMGKSFREKISSMLQSAPMHTRIPFLNRSKEYARLVPTLELGDDETFADAVLSKGPVTTGLRASLIDLYAQGDVKIGAGSKLRALAADGDVQLGTGVSLLRWIDAEKDIRVGANASLGHSVSAVGSIVLATNVRFRRLCGNPIVIGDSAAASGGTIAPGRWFSNGKRRMTSFKDTIAKGETVESDIISKDDVELMESATINGSVKSGGDVIVGPNATIVGNVVARGDVIVRVGGQIHGHVFAEGNVLMGRDSIIGAPGAAKTLYSSRDIQLAEGSRVYGWAICEGSGTTTATTTQV